MKLEIVTVTPHLARAWLGKNIDKNRRIRKNRVNFYAEQMTRGLWKVSPQGIVFDEDGFLLDGQHRLEAVIESGVTVEMAVIRGATNEAFDILDAGMNRSLGDRAKLSNEVVAICSILYRTVWGEGGAIAVSDIEYIYGVFENEITELVYGNQAKRRKISTAPVHAAVVLHLKEGNTAALEQYRAMVSIDTTAFKPATTALFKKLISDKVTGSSHDRTMLLMQAYRTLDPKHSGGKIVIIRDEALAVKAMRKRIQDFLDVEIEDE